MKIRDWSTKFAFLATLLATAATARAEDGPGLPPPFPDPAVRAWQVGVLRPDRLQHATLGFTGGALIGLPSESPGAALIGAATLGLAKELWDARSGRFDALDLAATCIGGLASAAVIIPLTR